MTAKRSALGRGLGALIPNREAESGLEAPSGPRAGLEDRATPLSQGEGAEGASEGPREIRVDLIDPNPEQPRRVFDPDLLEGLAASIVEHGVLQPVVVRRAAERFELVVGERRWRECARCCHPVLVLGTEVRKGFRWVEMPLLCGNASAGRSWR